jgi:hypothetical protein
VYCTNEFFFVLPVLQNWMHTEYQLEFLAFSFKMMVLCISDKCELILIFKEAKVAMAIEALEVQA